MRAHDGGRRAVHEIITGYHVARIAQGYGEGAWLSQTSSFGRCAPSLPDIDFGVNPMPKYELIIWWSEDDGAFLVEVPELPGCMADGATYEEAARNARVVIHDWIETAKRLGRPIPEPKGRLAYA